jgi:hypothetical protein
MKRYLFLAKNDFSASLAIFQAISAGIPMARQFSGSQDRADGSVGPMNI